MGRSLTRDEIQTKPLSTRLSMDELIGCLTYLTDEGRVKREDGGRYALTAKDRGSTARWGRLSELAMVPSVGPWFKQPGPFLATTERSWSLLAFWLCGLMKPSARRDLVQRGR